MEACFCFTPTFPPSLALLALRVSLTHPPHPSSIEGPMRPCRVGVGPGHGPGDHGSDLVGALAVVQPNTNPRPLQATMAWLLASQQGPIYLLDHLSVSKYYPAHPLSSLLFPASPTKLRLSPHRQRRETAACESSLIKNRMLHQAATGTRAVLTCCPITVCIRINLSAISLLTPSRQHAWSS